MRGRRQVYPKIQEGPDGRESWRKGESGFKGPDAS